MMHKLVLTSVVAFFPPGWELRIGMCVCIGYLCIILLTKPYARKSDDRLQILALVELFVIMLAAYSFRQDLNVGNRTFLALSDD